MTELTVWDSIKRVYFINFNIPDSIIEQYSVLDILKKCVSGISNLRISYGLKDNARYVRSILLEYLDFSGWEVDLDFSPIAVYNRCEDCFERYRQDVIMVSSLTPDYVIRYSFMLCRKYRDIERIVEKYVV